MRRHGDGSAGDADYGRIAEGYALYRRPDPRIAAAIGEALGDARSVLNVGAGAGSYEPTDRQVTAVEPSAAMRGQRPRHLPRAIDAVAEALPFADRSFDASMATFTVHQWPDLAAGLAEMRRVTRGPVVILTCDPAALDRFWLASYAPEVIAVEARRYPPLGAIAEALGGEARIVSVPVPLDCYRWIWRGLLRAAGGFARSRGAAGVFGLELRRGRCGTTVRRRVERRSGERRLGRAARRPALPALVRRVPAAGDRLTEGHGC